MSHKILLAMSAALLSAEDLDMIRKNSKSRVDSMKNLMMSSKNVIQLEPASTKLDMLEITIGTLIRVTMLNAIAMVSVAKIC